MYFLEHQSLSHKKTLINFIIGVFSISSFYIKKKIQSKPIDSYLVHLFPSIAWNKHLAHSGIAPAHVFKYTRKLVKSKFLKGSVEYIFRLKSTIWSFSAFCIYTEETMNVNISSPYWLGVFKILDSTKKCISEHQ